MTRALVSLGSNLGDRRAWLRGAREAFGGAVLRSSATYRTPPWGDPDQPDYLNAVLLVSDPARSAWDWLAEAHRIEDAAGRVRDPARRFGPRTLDVDLIAVWTDDGTPVILDDEDLTVPHPRAHLRAFVLRPWLDVDPDADLPGHGRVADLLTALGETIASEPDPSEPDPTEAGEDPINPSDGTIEPPRGETPS